MTVIRKIVHLIALALVPWGIVGCIQHAEAPGLPAASTQLAVLATRIAALETDNASLATEVAHQSEFISSVATRMPPPIPTLPPAPPTPYDEFQGSVSIEGGRCCVGAVAGQELIISVEFSAHSPFGAVTEMRVASALAGLAEDKIESASWEPFAPTRQITVVPPINWIGFGVAVQYRDAQGNLSPVYRAEISIEGMPAIPSAIPSP
jgi:hypothetical protein